MSSQKTNREPSKEKKALDLFFKRHEHAQAAEQKMLAMDLDEALLVLNAPHWVEHHITFFAGYLAGRVTQPRAEAPSTELILLVADIIRDCKLTDGSKLRASTKTPSMLIFYAIRRVAAAVRKGVNLQRYLRDEYKIPGLEAVDSANDTVDKTAQTTDEDREGTEVPSRCPSSYGTWSPPPPSSPSMPTPQPSVTLAQGTLAQGAPAQGFLLQGTLPPLAGSILPPTTLHATGVSSGPSNPAAATTDRAAGVTGLIGTTGYNGTHGSNAAANRLASSPSIARPQYGFPISYYNHLASGLGGQYANSPGPVPNRNFAPDLPGQFPARP
ncbi:RNA-binding ATPase activator esf2 [Hypoxylon texense]